MVPEEVFCTIARSFPDVTEEPHFHKTSFRIRKKIFATYDAHANLVCVKLNAIDQDVFISTNRTCIYPATGTWGAKGWTMIELSSIRTPVLRDILTTAYLEVAHSHKL